MPTSRNRKNEPTWLYTSLSLHLYLHWLPGPVLHCCILDVIKTGRHEPSDSDQFELRASVCGWDVHHVQYGLCMDENELKLPSIVSFQPPDCCMLWSLSCLASQYSDNFSKIFSCQSKLSVVENFPFNPEISAVCTDTYTSTNSRTRIYQRSALYFIVLL